MKSRVLRETGKHNNQSVIFVSSNVKTEFYLATKSGVKVIDFLEAVRYLKARPEEQAVSFTDDTLHYRHVNEALLLYRKEYVEAADTTSIHRTDLDRTSQEARNFLRTVKQLATDSELKAHCDLLAGYINEGIYAQLPRRLKTLSREYKNDRTRIRQDEYKLQLSISQLLEDYRIQNREHRQDQQEISAPQSSSPKHSSKKVFL